MQLKNIMNTIQPSSIIQNNNAIKNMRILHKKYIQAPAPAPSQVELNKLQTITIIDIFTPGFIAHVARLLATILRQEGVKTNVFIRNLNNNDITACQADNGRYLFIFSPQLLLQKANETKYPHDLLPLPTNKYFLYQLDNFSTKNPRSFNPHILNLIQSAKHIFEVSPKNIGYYPSNLRKNVTTLIPQSIQINNPLIKNTIRIKFLYTALFHKYVLGIRNPETNYINTNYTVVKEETITKKNICHIHCLYLKFLDSMFGNYISQLLQIFDIIVTYTHADNDTLNKYTKLTFIRVNNYGMDIGSKFIIYEYLKNKNISYNYVFYMHSKSCDKARDKYLMPFIKNLDKINLNNITNMCYFNNIIKYGDGENDNKWSKYNKVYMNDILSYLQIKQFKHVTTFEEGNFYILNKKIIDKIFSDKLLYNILNTENSFDYNWVNCFYKLNSNNIQDVYNIYIQKRLFGNNVPTHKGHGGLADAMTEHIFERLPIILCKEYGVNINILN